MATTFGDQSLFKIQKNSGVWVDITLTSVKGLFRASLGTVNPTNVELGGECIAIDSGGFFPTFIITLIANDTAETTIIDTFTNLLNATSHLGYYRLYPSGSGIYYEVIYDGMPLEETENGYMIRSIRFKTKTKQIVVP